MAGVSPGSGSDEQSQAARWLNVLREGSTEEQQHARTELGLILERLGLVEDAATAYQANVDAGVADRRPYERLAGIARTTGDAVLEACTLRARANLLDPVPEPLHALSRSPQDSLSPVPWGPSIPTAPRPL